jgi:integrase/recombinase XerD
MTHTATIPGTAPDQSPDSTELTKLLDDHLEYLALKHYSPETLKVRRIRLNMFVRWCTAHGLTEPGKITRSVVEHFQAHLFHYRTRHGEPLGWSTQHSRLISLGVWLKWMARRSLLEYNPVAEIELPRAVYKLPEVLTSRESEAVLHRATTANGVTVRDRAILETFYSTGMRRGELLHLKLHDFDMQGGVVAIRGGKGNRDHVIPVGDRCLAWIRTYLADVRSVW